MPIRSFPPDSDFRIALRKQLRERRAAIGASERVAAAGALVAQLEAIPEFLTDTNVAGYWAVAGELPLAAVIGGLRGRGQVYHLPIIDEQRHLRFAPWWPGGAIEMNRFGIPEPKHALTRLMPDAMDVVLVPLVGFDRLGYRLGFGGGYYDRTFAFLRRLARPAKPLLVGIGYAVQEVEHIEPTEWDVKLDYVATERELLDCTGAGS
ncbi:MAG TPA: 5-formyltetrahydrofolate cyclo-ligase [Rhodanobacteraceae bacterium]